MAAYAAVVSLMNDLELIPNHPTHSFSFDNKQITSLSQIVYFLIDFIESYDTHGCNRESAEVLESRIASAAHAAHDVIESHVVDQIHAGTTLGGKATSCFLRLRLRCDLQKAIKKMDFVKRKALRFQAKSGSKAEHSTYSPPPASSEPPTTSEKNVMVGFDAVVVRLLEMLTGEPSSHRVIPVVGMGGIGKTTLARSAYDHSLIHHHFDVRLWATISQEYSVETIFSELLSGERNSATGGNVSGLGEKLHEKLWGRRYLIVLDDMWSVGAWEEIGMFLPHNDNGSCVIVTSRVSNLASDLSAPPFEMNFLDDDKSWELFCGKAFGGEEYCPVELEEIGKKIVKRCRGLPLSIVVIGGHLRSSSRAIKYWEKVANFMNPIWSIGADECLEILSLSYEHLPACLKPCFLYLGIFEEDAWIDASGLLKLWVGEGFVRPNKSRSLEEVAEDYLKDLIDRNLILVRERRWNGKVGVCGIHDVVRELCLKIGKKEKFMGVVEDTTEGIGRERRIVIPKAKKRYSDMIGALRSAPLLRSLISQEDVLGEEITVDGGLSVDLRLMRLSENVDTSKCFSASKFQQVNLRYLALSCDLRYLERDYLPSSISLFWNMQTLIIRVFGRTPSTHITVPYEIWEMSQLRHLLCDGTFRICHFRLPDPVPGDTSNQQECVVLRNLQTLGEVENMRLTEEVCKRMPNIKDLSLYYRDDCEGSSYYCLHNLGRLNKLESLNCSFPFNGDSKWRDVFLSFILPSSLVELILSHCHWEDLTKVMTSLPRLGCLELHWVEGPEWDLAEEKFTSLKILRIVYCFDLIYWNADSSHFPVLENLSISYSLQLSEIPFDIGEIPTLGRILLSDCSVSAAVSAMRIVVEQENSGNENLLLEVRFYDKMEEVERFREMVQEECLTSNSLLLWNGLEEIKLWPSEL